MKAIGDILELAARRIESGDWRAHVSGGKLESGWLVGATFVGDMGAEYRARRAFSDWWAPASYRNDGCRINETAGEKGERLGAATAARALRAFAATLATGAAV